jgi:hypothetical protein
MTQGREAVLAWKIVSGNYAGEDLSGLRLVAVLVGRFTLSDATTLRRSTVYVDLEAKESQRRAGVAWLRARFGDLLGEVLAVRDAPVVFRVDESAAELSVGNILEIRMRPADLILDTQAWASLLYEPFIKLTSATMATSLHNQYAGSELAIRWWRSDSTLSGITGYFGTFTTR